MTLQEIIIDIHTLNDDLEVYERKYGVLCETFFESYSNGEEPEDDSWVLDWVIGQGLIKFCCVARINIAVPSLIYKEKSTFKKPNFSVPFER